MGLRADTIGRRRAFVDARRRSHELSTPPTGRIPGRRFLHSPGPTHIPDEVLDAMHRQPMDLADPRVDRTIAACESGLRRLLGTKGAEVFMYAANGHGAWEVALVNLAAPGQSVLVAGTGHFSESWAVQAEALGIRVVRTPWAEGLPIDPVSIEQALRADTAREIRAVCVVHTDTASGVTSDLAAIRRAIDASGHPALYVVDVVASLAAAPFAMDELGANVAVGASQKGLMLPPGLGFVAVDERAFEVSSRNPAPRFYWDWRSRRSELSYRKFCGTPPLNLLMGLEAALGLLAREGIDAVHARHRLLADTVHAAVRGWSEGGAIGFFARQPESRSVSVTAITIPAGSDPDAIRAFARERMQVAISGGLGPLAGRVIRIGHLGDINAAMVLGCLAGVQATFHALGIASGGDGVRRAAEFLAAAQSGRGD
ncbi:MAG: aminotransferase class V-fold PLP-dependent enzyme [Burkholderiaceae bacterium]|nr:aminotransferase class V-fold PLP-dependent enzyme [Burkholderiaceae bacterium]